MLRWILFTESKSDLRIIIMMILPFLVFLTLMLLFIYLFCGSVKETLICDASACSYQQYNTIGKVTSYKNFAKDDIYDTIIKRDRVYRESEKKFLYIVYLRNQPKFYLNSEGALNELSKYKNNEISQVSYTSSDYKDIFTVLAILAVFVIMCLIGWVKLYIWNKNRFILDDEPDIPEYDNDTDLYTP